MNNEIIKRRFDCDAEFRNLVSISFYAQFTIHTSCLTIFDLPIYTHLGNASIVVQVLEQVLLVIEVEFKFNLTGFVVV